MARVRGARSGDSWLAMSEEGSRQRQSASESWTVEQAEVVFDIGMSGFGAVRPGSAYTGFFVVLDDCN